MEQVIEVIEVPIDQVDQVTHRNSSHSQGFDDAWVNLGLMCFSPVEYMGKHGNAWESMHQCWFCLGYSGLAMCSILVHVIGNRPCSGDSSHAVACSNVDIGW
jgi:hypothetical protein